MTTVNLAKAIAAVFPKSVQQKLKKIRFAYQIRNNEFQTSEPEFALLPSMLKPGDVAVDVGANIGHYTVRMAQLVSGRTDIHGKVFAFEPIRETFDLLKANCEAAHIGGVDIKLFNTAVGDTIGTVKMSVPKFDTGLDDNYEAHIADDGDIEVAISSLDDMVPAQERIILIKIDVEGHELTVLKGAQRILDSCKPLLIIENNDPRVHVYLENLGYTARPLNRRSGARCPNVVWEVLTGSLPAVPVDGR